MIRDAVNFAGLISSRTLQKKLQHKSCKLLASITKSAFSRPLIGQLSHFSLQETQNLNTSMISTFKIS